jgi:hypothetical protein
MLLVYQHLPVLSRRMNWLWLSIAQPRTRRAWAVPITLQNAGDGAKGTGAGIRFSQQLLVRQ